MSVWKQVDQDQDHDQDCLDPGYLDHVFQAPTCVDPACRDQDQDCEAYMAI